MDSNPVLERPVLRPLDSNRTPEPAAHNTRYSPAVADNQENASLSSKPVADLPLKQQPVAAPAEQARPRRRTSLTAPEDLAKLNTNFDQLNEQLRQIRKEPGKPGWNTSTKFKKGSSKPDAQPSTSRTHGLATRPPVPRIADVKQPQPQPQLVTALFTLPTQDNPSDCMARAIEVFQERKFLSQCLDALNAQLTRSAEGANKDVKIQELAAMVKAVRRCMKECGTRVSLYADFCSRRERDVLQQMQQLVSSKTVLQQEFEEALAQARHEVNMVNADHAKQRLQLVSDSERYKYELSRVQVELKGMQQEREQMQVSLRSAEAARDRLENELKDCRRQLSIVQGNSQRNEEENNVLKQQLESMKQQLAVLQRDHREAHQDAQARVQQQSALASQLEMYKRELMEEKSRSGQLSSRNSQLEGDNTTLRLQAQRATTEADALRRSVDSLKAQLADANQQHDADTQAWQQEQDVLKRERAALQLQVQELQAQLRQLTAALKEAEEQAAATRVSLEQANSSLGELQQEHGELQRREADLNQQLDKVSSELSSTQQQLRALGDEKEALQQAWEANKESLEADLEAVRGDLAAKMARLAHLEGEFEALQEVIGEGDHKDVVQRLLSKISNLQQAAAQAEELRRKLHNQIIEMRGNIRVFCRVRPYPNPDASVRCLQDGSSLVLNVDGKDHGFRFDQVFAPGATQADVFTSVSELVQSALDGYHVCLFSYGQTGAGKTHTMQGTPDPNGRGIIPRAVEKVLATAKALEAQEWEYSFEASFIEIYNNTLRDLLAPAGSKDHGRITDQNAVKHDPSGGHTVVVGATRCDVPDAGVAADLVARAAAARAVESTAMNATSSRSHSVFMLYITGRHPITNSVLHGCLCLVDLAGSERLDRSGAEAERKKEACSINQSLSALGDVFAALASKSSHIPYRNSKLTYLLQPCLGGSGKTLMFVNVNPEPLSASETLQSLKFATKVNGCETAAKGGAKRNITTVDANSSKAPSSTPMARRPSVAPSSAETPGNSVASRASGLAPRRVSMLPSASKPAAGTKRPVGASSLQIAKRSKPV